VFSVAPTFITRNGENLDVNLFSSEEPVGQEPAYSETYHTGEKGVATFSMYRLLGEPEFAEQEKEELKVYLDAILIVLGRFRMINAVKQIGLTDQLTGLPNTGGFLTYVDEVIAKGELHKYNSFYFNLARFSLVNKRFGVKETDTIIYRYAMTVSAFLQEGECLGRLGGDNFVALIRKERTQEFLSLIAAVETYGMMNGRNVPVVISAVAGVYEIDETVKHCGSLLENSSIALNVAKHVTKRPFAFATEEMKKRMDREKQYMARFTDAIKNREFKAYYQPKVHTDEFSIVGAEALIRWESDGKLLPPGEFVPLFERNGLICDLDFYVLEQVCMDIREWLGKGINPGRVSINLSRKHLSNPNLAEDIMRILGKHETESRYVEIELTETVDEDESEQLIRFMNKMKNNNISMSIDDFGTGYSSLNLLRTFPVDVLKIDKIFIDSLEENDKIVLSNIIRMATELRMDVVAEGVETRYQMECLHQMGCKVVQGFLFDRPMPKEEFEQRMLQKKYKPEEII
jgi:diguanylate cyclase (GGDEF)-like protein